MMLESEESHWNSYFSFAPSSGEFGISFPVAPVPFIPRYAYKAVAKMGFALLPDEELVNYQKLKSWLRDVDDDLDFPVLEVAMSFGSIGNAPPLVCSSLLRRMDRKDKIPHMIFIFSAGSICLQIDLMSDHLEDHLPPVSAGGVKIRYSNVLGGLTDEDEIRIEYGDPVFFNWSSRESAPQPIDSIVLEFCPETRSGKFTPIFRG